MTNDEFLTFTDWVGIPLSVLLLALLVFLDSRSAAGRPWGRGLSLLVVVVLAGTIALNVVRFARFV